MIYMLEFTGLLGIALALAASPFLIGLLESIVAGSVNRRPSGAGYHEAGAASEERSEMRNEIRRAMHILETERRRAQPDVNRWSGALAASPRSAGK